MRLDCALFSFHNVFRTFNVDHLWILFVKLTVRYRIRFSLYWDVLEECQYFPFITLDCRFSNVCINYWLGIFHIFYIGTNVDRGGGIRCLVKFRRGAICSIVLYFYELSEWNLYCGDNILLYFQYLQALQNHIFQHSGWKRIDRLTIIFHYVFIVLKCMGKNCHHW